MVTKNIVAFFGTTNLNEFPRHVLDFVNAFQSLISRQKTSMKRINTNTSHAETQTLSEK